MEPSLTQAVAKREFAGIPFVRASLQEASGIVRGLARERSTGVDVHLLNAYSIALAEQNYEYRACLEQATHNFPDGKPLSTLTKLSRSPLYQVRGPSLFELVMDEGRAESCRHYLLGATSETLIELKTALEERYPGLHIVGMQSPPFRSLAVSEMREQDNDIRSASPDIVWVGLGTPKQDFEVSRLASEGFMAIAVGAAFDFSAGTKKTAPSWMTTAGLEWLYRFGSEPRRLWRRYLVGNVIFLKSAMRRGL